VRGMGLLYHFEAGRQEEALPFFLRPGTRFRLCHGLCAGRDLLH
jgi:hypothetical protein